MSCCLLIPFDFESPWQLPSLNSVAVKERKSVTTMRKRYYLCVHGMVIYFKFLNTNSGKRDQGMWRRRSMPRTWAKRTVNVIVSDRWITVHIKHNSALMVLGLRIRV